MKVSTGMRAADSLKTNVPGSGRRLRIGPGIVIAALAAAAILYQQGAAKRPAPAAGRLVYEADAGGRMRRVGAPTPAREQSPPLWKPEVSVLLNGVALDLSSGQRTEITTLNREWLHEKTVLEPELERAASDTGLLLKGAAPMQGAEVRGSLSDYSALSEEYDQRRAAYWEKAMGLLTPDQRKRLSEFRQKDGKRR